MSRAYDNAADGRYQQGGRRNLIINGNFDVWQRGTTFNTATVSDHYSADRWKYYNYDGDTTVTQQPFTVGQTDVPGEPQYYLRHTCGSTEFYVEQRIEDVRTAAGQTVTMSAWIKSSVAQTLKFRLYQNFGSGGSSQVLVTNTDVAVTTGWARYTLSIDVPSISGKTIGTSSFVKIHIGGSSVTDGSTIDISQVQLELGNIATPFEHRSYGEELALCQRYHYRVTNESESDAAMMESGSMMGTAECVGVINHPVEMRAKPTYSQNGTLFFRANNSQTLSASPLYQFTTTKRTTIWWGSLSGTAGISGYIRANTSDLRSYTLDAEL